MTALVTTRAVAASCSEMLSAGVPVIVPGGCWLSEQIHDENQRHLRDIAAHGTPLKKIDTGSIAASRRGRRRDFIHERRDGL